MADDQRPIDQAMALESRPKGIVRQSWLEEIERRAAADDPERVLYVTLCGKHGLDIEMLVRAGLIQTLENGAVDLAASRKVVAYEASAPAATAVKAKFPGLDVREMDIHNELRLKNPLNFPDLRTRPIFEASVINLDYDRAIQIQDSQLTVVRAISKISQLEAVKRCEWSLMLTLNATVSWAAEDDAIECAFLEGCLDACGAARGWLGEDAVAAVRSGRIGGLSTPHRQAALLALICARVAEAVAIHGWTTLVRRAFSYGGEDGHAPMDSWVFRFQYDESASRRVRQCITLALTSLAKLSADVSLVDDPERGVLAAG